MFTVQAIIAFSTERAELDFICVVIILMHVSTLMHHFWHSNFNNNVYIILCAVSLFVKFLL